MLASFPPWRYPHLFKLWQLWLTNGQEHQLDRWLETQFRANKQFGKKDRNAYREAFFAAMRYLQLAHALEYAYQQNDTDWQQWDKNWRVTPDAMAPAAFWYWVLLRAEIATPPPRELADGEARLAFFEATATHWPGKALLSPSRLLWQGYRPSWAEALEARQRQSLWSETELEQFIEQSNTPAPVCLRPQHCDAAALALLLKEEGIESVSPESQSPALGLQVAGNINVKNSAAYQQGKFELQDTASQMLAAALKPSAEDTVWDVCAGAGGKTLAFANTAPASHILSTDIRSNALKQLALRSQHGGFTNITAQQHDACEALPATLVPEGGFDGIFIDAPCSASGTWRRAADARWRMEELNQLLSLQQRIFANAAKHLKQAGYLIYATCSWLESENETQVEQFLSQNPQFELLTQHCLGSPQINADTMFYAKLRRHT